MARYDAEVEIAFSVRRQSRPLIPDSGSYVTVEYYNGLNWVEDEQSPISEAVSIRTDGLRIKFTPSAGGAFFIDEEIK